MVRRARRLASRPEFASERGPRISSWRGLRIPASEGVPASSTTVGGVGPGGAGPQTNLFRVRIWHQAGRLRRNRHWPPNDRQRRTRTASPAESRIQAPEPTAAAVDEEAERRPLPASSQNSTERIRERSGHLPGSSGRGAVTFERGPHRGDSGLSANPAPRPAPVRVSPPSRRRGDEPEGHLSLTWGRLPPARVSMAGLSSPGFAAAGTMAPRRRPPRGPSPTSRPRSRGRRPTRSVDA